MTSTNNTDFQSTLDILERLVNNSKTKRKRITDNDLKDADFEAIQKHTKIYTDYLDAYVKDYTKKSESQRIMKICFFIITMLLLSLMILGGFIAIVIICQKDTIDVSDVVTVITAVTGAVSSFLILPKVIAENLFPSMEQDKTTEIFGKMFDHDISLRGIYHISDNAVNHDEEKMKNQ